MKRNSAQIKFLRGCLVSMLEKPASAPDEAISYWRLFLLMI